MNQQNLDFRVTRDIRNAPIVREIDRRRQRELWRSLAVGVCFVGVILFSAWQNFELIRYGYEIEQMEQERSEQLDLNRHLLLEIETLSAPQRIERLATAELGLSPPAGAGVKVVERHVGSPRPDGAVMADRDAGTLVVPLAARQRRP